MLNTDKETMTRGLHLVLELKVSGQRKRFMNENECSHLYPNLSMKNEFRNHANFGCPSVTHVL